MRKKQRQNGFTLVELSVALLVTSIVLAAVAVLANATVIASMATDEMGRSQANLRQVSMRLSDLIRRANRVTVSLPGEFQLWHDNNADGLMTADELTRIARGADGNTLSIGASESHAVCRNIVFGYDVVAPETTLVTVWYDLTDNGQTQRYSVCAHLRGSDEHRKF